MRHPFITTAIVLAGLAVVTPLTNASSVKHQLHRSPDKRTYRAVNKQLALTLVLQGPFLIDITTRAVLHCDDDTFHRSLLAEGVPVPNHLIHIKPNGEFSYHVFSPAEVMHRVTPGELEKGVSSALYEAMNGYVHGNAIMGRLRFWERMPRDQGPSRRCGTRAPAGRWVRFTAHLTR